MSLHSGAMGDLNLIAWLQDRLAAPYPAHRPDERQQGPTLASLLDETIQKLQYSTRSTLLQMMLTAHDYLMVQGRLHTPISTEASALILHAMEGLLLNNEVEANIDILLELMPKDLHREYRRQLQNEAQSLADEYNDYSAQGSGGGNTERVGHDTLPQGEMQVHDTTASQEPASIESEPQLLWPEEESGSAIESIALDEESPPLNWPVEALAPGDDTWPLLASASDEDALLSTADTAPIALEPLSSSTPSRDQQETPLVWPQEEDSAGLDVWPPPATELHPSSGAFAADDFNLGSATRDAETFFSVASQAGSATWPETATESLQELAEESPSLATRPLSESDNQELWYDAPSSVTDSAHPTATNDSSVGALPVTSQLDLAPPLLLVIDMAVEDITALGQDAELTYATMVQRAVDHLENIAFAAESCSFGPFAAQLRKRAEALQQSADGAPASPKALLRGTLEFLSGARQQAITLLETVTSNPVAQPPAMAPSVTEQPPLEVTPTAEMTPIAETEEITYSDERLAVLAEELAEIEPELVTLANILVEAEDAALLEPLARYGDLMSRLVAVCDALGMEGLKRVVTTIADNSNLLPSLEQAARPASRHLFHDWPASVERYLRDPSDGPAADALIDLLQAKQWPAPLSGIDSRDLFTLLIAGPTVEETNHEPSHRPSKAAIEDVSLAFDPDVNRDLFESFLIEAPDLAAQFNATMTHLGEGNEMLEALRKAQRMSHTLKGSANLIGIKGIANLAHHTEDILDTLARTRTAPPAPLRDALARSGDCLEGMIDAVHGLAPPPEDALEVLQLILDCAHSVDRGEYDKLPSAAAPAPTITAAPPVRENRENEAVTATGATADALSSVRVASTTIDDMFRLVEEITISQGQIREQVSRLKKLGDMLAGHEQILQGKRFNLENLVDIRSIANMQRKAHRQRIARDEFDPLEMDQYDELHAATHSYIEAVADARELNQFVVNNVSKLDSLLLRQDRLNKELQQLVGATRLVPVAMIASRLERAVRQACRVTQKQATLEIIGRQFLIDGEVLNKLVDPLLHMLRNAVDHGIEPAEERLEQGKSPQGTITLEFRQEGNNIVVSCRDDGRGLDYVRIAEVAQQKGLVQHTQQMSREQLAQLILSPAFTTRSTATQLSGRGIGLDAVQSAVTALKGNIAIGDNEGGGTEFTILLPTSLVTSHSLIVRSGNERFAIPTSYLQQILPPGSGRITLYGDTETFQLGSAFYPLHTLNELLGLGDETPKESKTVLITAAGSRGGTAVAVDYVLQSAELVVKGLGKYVRNAAGSIGVSVLGDGQVIPVLDLPQLISGERTGQIGNIIDGQLSHATLDEGIKRPPQVLIVDDSLSVRNTLSQLLNDVGYRTQAARDGVEALELIRKKAPAIVLTDLEMPRMDGMELTRSLRDNPATEQLPIIMITSRTQAKHRNAAEQAGINAYVTKPFMEEELLDTIGTLLENHAHA